MSASCACFCRQERTTVNSFVLVILWAHVFVPGKYIDGCIAEFNFIGNRENFSKETARISLLQTERDIPKSGASVPRWVTQRCPGAAGHEPAWPRRRRGRPRVASVVVCCPSCYLVF